MATMIGTMMLARAVDDAALSDRLLHAGKAHLLKGWPIPTPRGPRRVAVGCRPQSLSS
jgi:hypothetical protein